MTDFWENDPLVSETPASTKAGKNFWENDPLVGETPAKAAPADFNSALEDFDAHAGQMRAANAQPEQSTIGKVADYVRGMDRAVVQGATMSGGDELTAAMRSVPGNTGFAPLDFIKLLSAEPDDGSRSYGENLADTRRKIETFKGEHPYSSFVGEFAGGTATAMNPFTAGAVAPNLMRRMWQGAKLGGAYGGVQGFLSGDGNEQTSTEDGFLNRVKSSATNAFFGAGFGAAVPVASRTLEGAIGPWSTPQARELIERGVPTTFGETVGGPVKVAEDLARNTPVLGHAIDWAQKRSLAGFNKAAVNEAMSPIGQKLSPETVAGRDALVEAGQKVSVALSGAFSKLNGQADDVLAGTIETIRKAVPQRVRADFDDAISRTITKYTDSAGELAGRDLSRAMTGLRDEALKFMKTGNEIDRALGLKLLEAFDAGGQMLSRYNPGGALADLNAANLSAVRLARLEKAATGKADKVFTPRDLAQTGSGVPKDQTALREAMMQPLAEAGDAVMRRTMQDHGWGGKAIGTAILHASHLPTVGASLMAELAAAGMYTPQVQNGLRLMANGAYGPRLEAASQLRNFTTKAAPGAIVAEGGRRQRSEREWRKIRAQAGGRP